MQIRTALSSIATVIGTIALAVTAESAVSRGGGCFSSQQSSTSCYSALGYCAGILIPNYGQTTYDIVTCCYNSSGNLIKTGSGYSACDTLPNSGCCNNLTSPSCPDQCLTHISTSPG